MKRLNCTVRDKRGFQGDCMEVSPSGKYVSYSAYLHLKKELDKVREENRKLKMIAKRGEPSPKPLCYRGY